MTLDFDDLERQARDAESIKLPGAFYNVAVSGRVLLELVALAREGSAFREMAAAGRLRLLHLEANP